MAASPAGGGLSCVVLLCVFSAMHLLGVLPFWRAFYARCVDQWLRSQRPCPLCRGHASASFARREEQ
uniref:Putative e3 ubiquitin-protein ligase rnf38 n=1 Tax=Anopheles darlingi TaxID=43151 RepID=A0A2M4DDV0_ANODA